MSSGLRTRSFDALVSAKAVDKTSARVTARGVHWEPDERRAKNFALLSETPLPTRPYPRVGAENSLPLGFKVGRLVVIGLAPKRAAPGARYVVRCSCGTYTHRSARYLKGPVAPLRAMCDRCDYIEYLRGTQIHTPRGEE